MPFANATGCAEAHDALFTRVRSGHRTYEGFEVCSFHSLA